MARKRLEVTRTPEEHESLSTSVAHGHQSARESNRARIFLLAPDGHTDADIAQVLGVSHGTSSKEARQNKLFVCMADRLSSVLCRPQ